MLGKVKLRKTVKEKKVAELERLSAETIVMQLEVSWIMMLALS